MSLHWSDPDWFARAACRGGDTEAWYPDKGDWTTGAKSVCNGDDERAPCSVRAECLEFALDTDQRWGIWGGMSSKERRRLRPRGRSPRATRPPAECGTESGYTRHRDEGTTTCRACKDAMNVAQRARNARREARAS